MRQVGGYRILFETIHSKFPHPILPINPKYGGKCTVQCFACFQFTPRYIPPLYAWNWPFILSFADLIWSHFSITGSQLFVLEKPHIGFSLYEIHMQRKVATPTDLVMIVIYFIYGALWVAASWLGVAILTLYASPTYGNFWPKIINKLISNNKHRFL